MLIPDDPVAPIACYIERRLEPLHARIAVLERQVAELKAQRRPRWRALVERLLRFRPEAHA